MKILTWLIAVIIAGAIFAAAVGYSQDASARRAYAAAAMVREQSQARQDLLAAMLPYVILGTTLIVTISITGLVVYALGRGGQQPGPQLIETRTIILLQPGQSRRDLWRLVSENTRRPETLRLHE